MSNEVKPGSNGQWNLNKSWDRSFDEPNAKGEHFHVLSDGKFKRVKETKDDNYHLSDGSKEPMKSHSETRWLHPDHVAANQPKNDFSQEFKKEDSAMAMASIVELSHHIKELKSKLQPGDKLPDWVEAKLTIASDYLSTIAHFVEGKKEAGSPLDKAATDMLDLLKGQLIELKDKIQPKVSDSVKAKKLLVAAKDLGVKTFKDRLKAITKEEKVLNYAAPEMAKLTSRQADAKIKASAEANRQRLGVKDGNVGTDPALSGIAGKYKLGTTKSGKAIQSHFDHDSHAELSEADHGEAAQFHREARNSLKPLVATGQTNPKLLEHHENAMMAHSKAQAQMRLGGGSRK